MIYKFKIIKLYFQSRMCGNQISTIQGPGQDFIALVEPQLAKRIIRIINREVGIPQINAIKSLNFSNVVSLELIGCRLTSDTLRAISQLGWQSLSKLSLNNNQLGPQGCKIISQSPSFGKILILQINKNGIKDEGLGYITRGGYKDGLQDLSVNDNQISNNSISKMSKTFKKLHCFSAGGNALNDETIQHLKANLSLQKLIYLKLSRNQITDAGLNKLLESQNIQQLQILLVERNKIQKPKKQYKSKSNLNKDLFLFY